MSVKACRDCGNPIEFVRTERDKVIPIDPDPVRGVLGPGPYPDGTPRRRRWRRLGGSVGGLAVVQRVTVYPVTVPGREIDVYKDHRSSCPAR